MNQGGGTCYVSVKVHKHTCIHRAIDQTILMIFLSEVKGTHIFTKYKGQGGSNKHLASMVVLHCNDAFM